MKEELRVIEPEHRSDGAILVVDRDDNDVAEFYHNEHATVAQSYERALGYALHLVGLVNR